MPTRRDKETTRQLLLEAGYEMILERGLEVGWGIRVAEVTERVGLTTGAAYQIWSGSRTRHGSGGQDRFHHDLALYALDRLINDPAVKQAPGPWDLASQGASLDRVIQAIAPGDFETFSNPAEYACFLALIASGASDPEIAAASGASYQQVTDQYVELTTKLLEHYELEMTPPHTVRSMVVTLIAMVDGLSVRSMVDPDAITDDHPSPEGVADDVTDEPWHLLGLGIHALFSAMTQPRAANDTSS